MVGMVMNTGSVAPSNQTNQKTARTGGFLALPFRP